MARTAVQRALSLMKRRKFSLAITLLESYSDYYIEDFEYYLTLGHAYLYTGDFGSAASYYQRARAIKINDTELLLGQAAIFLHRGDTERAIHYYLDILDIEPENKVAKAGINFIRDYGEYSVICRWYETGKLERFYPPLGINTTFILRGCFLGAVLGLMLAGALSLASNRNKNIDYTNGPRMNISNVELTADEKESPLAKDLSGTLVHFILKDREVLTTFEKAKMYFQDGRDNASLVEINRLLGSNASGQVKHKALLLEEYLFPVQPSFDTLTDNFTYKDVKNAEYPELYEGCYVAWSGRISDVHAYSDGSWSCRLLADYENFEKVSGIVTVKFAKENVLESSLDGEKPVRFLGRVRVEKGEIILDGIGAYQPLKGNSL